MNSSNVQDMASAATLFILLGILLVPCRAWCRGVARKVAVGSFRSRAALTRRLLRAMSWRVGLVVVGLVAFGLLGADGPRSFATQSFIPATILSYPFVLLSLWQIARRISKQIFDATSPEYCTGISPATNEAAIRAGRYRPTVIEGVVGAWFALTLLSLLVLMFANRRKAAEALVTNASQTPATISQYADHETYRTPLTASEEASHTLRGHDIAYTLQLPHDWTTKTIVEDFDTVSSYKSSYVGVVAEEAQVGTADTVATLARDRLKGKATDLYWSQPQPVELDGRTWLEFVVKCRMEGIPVGYEFYVYSGSEGTFQIVGWTTQNLFERDAERLRSVMQTFRFPSGSEANHAFAKDAERPLALEGLVLKTLQEITAGNVRVLRVTIKPATTPSEEGGVLKKTILTIVAQDNSPSVGDGIDPFKAAVGRNLSLQKVLGTMESIKLASLSQATKSPDGTAYVLFTLECKYDNAYLRRTNPTSLQASRWR